MRRLPFWFVHTPASTNAHQKHLQVIHSKTATRLKHLQVLLVSFTQNTSKNVNPSSHIVPAMCWLRFFFCTQELPLCLFPDQENGTGPCESICQDLFHSCFVQNGTPSSQKSSHSSESSSRMDLFIPNEIRGVNLSEFTPDICSSLPQNNCQNGCPAMTYDPCPEPLVLA
eukprot:TRINITY_DN1588_c3_g1_i1.p1 TRINITY_DN1588_c3_g1~~TRINITY_DN1588_c3_g1_i1.p1  ORF type:complete len:170 (-),score=24.30 TRINITY_DN1588_c3_g1_i1:102-611(-)